MVVRNKGYPIGYKDKSSYENTLPKTKSCIICGSEFEGNDKQLFCSKPCIEKNRIYKIKNTKLIKYGSESYNNRDKASVTCIVKYGCDNPSKNKDVISKIANTHFEKYGVTNVFKRRDIIEDAYEKAFGEGIINPQQVPEISKKTYETRKAKYILSGSVPKEASEKTCLEKYDNKSFFGSASGKMNRENLKNIYNYTDEEIDNIFQRRDSASFKHFQEKYNNDDYDKFREHNKKYDSSSYNWALGKSNDDEELANSFYISNIKKRTIIFGNASKTSLEVLMPIKTYLENFCNIIDDDIYLGIENKKEYFLWDNEYKRLYFYDFVIRSKKIIIEYNGCYFHPKNKEENVDKWERDKRKIRSAEEQGYTVLVVWDDISIEENITFLISKINKCLKTQNSDM